MATINLGRIKPVFRGAYAGGTAYVVDDIVTHGNETFICIQAGTGNATSNASYWTKLAAKGTDGTDVGTTLTTQGDILYRDGSGLQRLAKGTAGYYLKQGTNHPEWGAVSSDWVKLNHTDSTSSVSSHSFQSILDDNTYDGYKIILHTELTSNGSQLFCRLLNGSSELSGTTDYRRAGVQGYRRESQSEHSVSAYSDGDGRDSIDLTNWGFSSATGNVFFNEILIFGAAQDTSHYKCVFNRAMQRDNSSGSDGNYFAHNIAAYQYINYGTSVDGFKIYVNSGNFERLKISIYGMKK